MFVFRKIPIKTTSSPSQVKHSNHVDQIERGLENLNLKQTNMRLAPQSSSAEDKLRTNDDENDPNDESELTATGTAGENHYYSDDENYFRLVSLLNQFKRLISILLIIYSFSERSLFAYKLSC